jgi:hypothetical protein
MLRDRVGLSLAAGLLALSLSMPAQAQAPAGVWIFAPDGTLQCGMGQEIPLDEAKAALEKRGVRVLAAEKRHLPMMIVALCGAPTGAVNAFEISDADRAALHGAAREGFARWVFDKPTVAVFKYDGTLQCGVGKEVSLAAMAATLEQAGIKVISSRKADDGKLHIQLCGASTGRVNVFEIATPSLAAARKLGFAVFISQDTIRDMLGEEPKFRIEAAGAPAARSDVPWPW